MSERIEKHEVTVGSEWHCFYNGMKAKVVGLAPSLSSLRTVAEVVYDSGDGYEPSILPSTWCVEHWNERYRRLQETE